MDNLSHSLAGLLIGETASEISKSSRDRRLLLLFTSLLATNFPDLDLLYTWISPKPLGYLLHHRGHTHTLVGLIPQFVLIFAGLALIPRFRALLRERTTKLQVALVSAICLFAHIVMDSWNSYGIHPFWPFSSSWYYGDMVFILEPTIWISCAIPLFFSLHSRIVRLILALIIAAVPAFAWHKGFLAWYSLFGLAALAAVLAVILRFCPRTIHRLGFGFLSILAFLGLEFAASRSVRRSLEARLDPSVVQGRVLDIITDPMPANPFCWRTIQLERDHTAGLYRTTVRPVSLVPRLIADEDCPMIRKGGAVSEVRLDEFQAAVARDCQLRSWMKFARAPILAENSAFDIRYGPAGPDNFTFLENAGQLRDCPPFDAPWEMPRADILN